MLLDSKSVRNM